MNQIIPYLGNHKWNPIHVWYVELFYIYIYSFFFFFIYIAFFMACPEWCTKVKIQGLVSTKKSSREKKPNESSMKWCLMKILTEKKIKRIQSSDVWAKMDNGWLSDLRVFLQS